MQPKNKWMVYAQAVFSTAVLACILVAWILLPAGDTRSSLFFLLGLVLIWTWSSIDEVRELKGNPTQSEYRPSEEEVLAEKRHEERLASHPPRLTYAVMACISLVSALQLVSDARSAEVAGLVKPATRAGEWWRLLSATYLHGGIVHFWMNLGALRLFGHQVEVCSPRAHLPLVYLLSALGGNLASLLLLPEKTSIGASGAILGLAGYLLVLARRKADDVSPGLREWILVCFGITAYFGFFGFAFIDNAGHAGGAVTGVLVGMAAIPRSGRAQSGRWQKTLNVLGWVAALVLLVGALSTGLRLARS